MIKTNAIGDLKWTKTYVNSVNDHISSVIPTTDGGCAISGWSESYGGGKSDGWLIKVDKQGEVQWNQTYGGSEDENIFRVIQTSDGGFILTGFTKSYWVQNMGAWVVKTDPQGITAPIRFSLLKRMGSDGNRWVSRLLDIWDGKFVVLLIISIVSIVGVKIIRHYLNNTNNSQ